MKLLRTREWCGYRLDAQISRSLGAFETEGVRDAITLVVTENAGSISIDLTPRQALELSEHLLSFAVRCAQ